MPKRRTAKRSGPLLMSYKTSLLGQAGQDIAVEVGDELGPVLRVTALLASEILRKQ
jgi:hypothetical protein